MKDKIVEMLSQFLNQLGIDPIYFSTIICILITFYYKEEFKNWTKSSLSNKLLAISSVFASLILVIISIFKLLREI